MEEGYYSRRLDDLEKRKVELLAQRKINKMSLDGVNKEIEACKEAMNNQTKVVDTHADSKDTYILKLKNRLDEANKTINLLKKDKTQLKHDLTVNEQKIKRLKNENDDLKNEIRILKIDIGNLKSNNGETIFPEDRSDENIFEQIMRGLDEKENANL